MSSIYWAMIAASLIVNGCILYRDKREVHRWRQHFRLKWDGYAPPWWMGWTYWFGVERLFFGKKMQTEDRMASYLRYEFD